MIAYSRPVRCLALVLLAWGGMLASRALPVGGSWQAMDLDVWALMLGWIAAYSVAFIIVSQGLPAIRIQADVRYQARWVRRWVILLSGIAIIGASLIAYEFAIVRGYGFTTPVALIRNLEVQNAAVGFGGSVISGLGRLFTPTLQIAWLLAVLRWRDIAGIPKALLWLATATVFFEQTMYEGGRFFLATLIVNCLVAKALGAWGQRAAPQAARVVGPKRRILSFGSIIVLGVAFVSFAFVFIDRVTALELDFGGAYVSYTKTFDIDVGPDVLERLNSANAPAWFAAAMFWIYITQGPNELAVQMGHENLTHAYGLFQFPQLGQAISKLTDASVGYDVFTNLPNPGTYNTLAGAGYIDFGFFGSLLCALIIGALTAAATAAFSENRLRPLTLCAPIFMTLGLFSPIISLVTNLWPALLWAMLVGVTATKPQGRHTVVASARNRLQLEVHASK